MNTHISTPDFFLYGTPLNLLNSVMVKTIQHSDAPPSSPGKSKTKDKSKTGARRYDFNIYAIAEHKDRAAFIELFNFFAPRVKSFLMRGGFSPEIADELAQDTMLNVWTKASGFDASKASASTWIYTIARNKKIDYLRKQYRSGIDEHDPSAQPQPLEAPDEHIKHEELSDKLHDAMKDIPEEQRSLIEKSFCEDKTHQQIAEETGLPLGTVKSRIRLAMERMRHKLSGEEL